MPNNLKEDPGMANARTMATQGRSNVLADWQAQQAQQGNSNPTGTAWQAMGRRLTGAQPSGSIHEPDKSENYSIRQPAPQDR